MTFLYNMCLEHSDLSMIDTFNFFFNNLKKNNFYETGLQDIIRLLSQQ